VIAAYKAESLASVQERLGECSLEVGCCRRLLVMGC
jgi:hypothetical protein